MADRLSVVAPVAGISTAAIQSVQFLSATIDNIKDAPTTIRNIVVDLQAVEPALRNLETACRNDAHIVLSAEIKSAVENCNEACSDFQTLLTDWMKHSAEDKMFWADRWRVGLFGQERIKVFKGRLSDCKSTLNVARSTATIITTTRQEGIMKEMKDMMLQQNENVLQKEIARVDGQGTEMKTFQELEQNRQELLREIRQQQASNDTLRKICEDAISRTINERTGQKIKGVKATDHSSALAGFINTSGEELRVDQDISDVNAHNKSFAGAGVIKGLDFRNMRPGAHE